LAVAAGAEEVQPSRQPPDFRQLAPLPSVREAAHAAQFALEDLASPVSREGLRPGDSVTALVTLSEGKELKQWLIEVAAVVPSEKEKKAVTRSTRLFTSSGYEFNFGSGCAALEIRMFGPLREDDTGRKAATAPEVKRRRIVTSSDFLALGLERMPALILRKRAAEAANPSLSEGIFDIGSQLFPRAVTEANRKRMEAHGIAEADERAAAGCTLALSEFFRITSNTPGLQDVLKSVIDVPWWSILRSGGKEPETEINMAPTISSVRQLDGTRWGLGASAKVYSLPFQLDLNGKPALLCQLAVVPPQPPLLVSAGIIGLAAGRPDGKGPVLTLQVITSRVAIEKPAP
jgi:hypothetical protein